MTIDTTAMSSLELTPRMAVAVDEIRNLILDRFPEATFEVGQGDDPVGIYATATGDMDSPWDVIDVVRDRLLHL